MLKSMINIPLIREAIENHLISSIEKKEEETGNTPLHAVAGTDNDKVLKFLLNNGASATQFMKNKDGKIPLEISKNKSESGPDYNIEASLKILWRLTTVEAQKMLIPDKFLY